MPLPQRKKHTSEICNCQISYVGSCMICMSIKTAPVGSFGFCLGLQTLDLGRLATLAVDWQKHRLLAAGEDSPDPNSADVEHRIWGHFVGSCFIKASRCAKIWWVSDFHPCPCEKPIEIHVRSTEGWAHRTRFSGCEKLFDVGGALAACRGRSAACQRPKLLRIGKTWFSMF